MLDESKCKPNKVWVDKGSEFYNISKKSWLKKNDVEMYSTDNEGKVVIAEKFIIFKYMKSISKICVLKN